MAGPIKLIDRSQVKLSQDGVGQKWLAGDEVTGLTAQGGRLS